MRVVGEEHLRASTGPGERGVVVRPAAHGQLGPRRRVGVAHRRPGHHGGRAAAARSGSIERFLAYREGLGMEVLPLTGGERDVLDVLPHAAARRPAGALVADRDLRASGIEVDAARRADPDAGRPGGAGAAHRRRAAPGEHLVRGGRHGPAAAGHPVPRRGAPAGASAPRREKVAAMTQEVADVFGAAIAEHPADWHMLQRLWLGRPRPGPRPPADRDRAVKVGIVCPYSWDVPGGVQVHVRDLAEALQGRGHTVSVLAPADDDTPLPPYVVPAGRAVPVRYNGSVARVTFGPLSAARVRRWLREGELRRAAHPRAGRRRRSSLLACWAATGPIVGDVPHLQPAVAGDERRVPDPASRRWRRSAPGSRCPRTPGDTLVEHLGGDAVLIPNGVFVDRFAAAPPRAEWRGAGGTVGFLGRLDEPRKGLPMLLRRDGRGRRGPARRAAAGGRPRRRGGGSSRTSARRSATAVTLLGVVDEEDKARLLRTVDVFVAPNLGGESFGIVLVEAMSAGAPVLASDLDAFRRVLDDGRVGATFPVGDTAALAGVAARPARRRAAPGAAVGGRVGVGAPLRLGDGRRRAAGGVRDGRGRRRRAVAEDLGRPWRDRLRR